jgi:hypothetical protein
VSASRAFAAAAAAVGALTLVPSEDSPLRRLAGGAGDGPDPRFDVPLNAQALKNITLPDGTRYATRAPDESPLAQGNLKAAGQLYLAHLLPVQDPRRASVVFTYRDGVVR